MEIRLQKYMADCGIASRRASEQLILDGKVKVNGRVVKDMGIKINPDKDHVHYDGKIIEASTRMVYFMLNKPKGYITSAKDEKDRKTVFDLIKVKERLFTIGRLDQGTSGMLLLTNDGDLTYKLTHPKHEIDKTYIVEITPKIGPKEVKQLMGGVVIDDQKTTPCEIELIREEMDTQGYKVIIHEGKNRQVRKMFELYGCRILSLKRTRIGTLKLDGLKRGQYRPLTKDEVKYLKGI